MANLLERYSENGTDNQNEEQTIEELESIVSAQEETIIDLLVADRPGQEMVSSNENLGREILIGLGVVVVINVILGIIGAIVNLLFGGRNRSETDVDKDIKASNERIKKMNEEMKKGDKRQREFEEHLRSTSEKSGSNFSAKDKKESVGWSKLQEDVVNFQGKDYLKCFFECEKIVFGDLMGELDKVSDLVVEIHRRGVSEKRISDVHALFNTIETKEEQAIKVFPITEKDFLETVHRSRDRIIHAQNEKARLPSDYQRWLNALPETGMSKILKEKGIQIGAPSEKENEKVLRDIETLLKRAKKGEEVSVEKSGLSEEEEKELLKKASEAEKELLSKTRDVLKAIAMICQTRLKLMNVEKSIKSGIKQFNPKEKVVS